MSITAAAKDNTPVCIERSAAESCKAKTEQFDALLSEAEKVRRQRDEAVGAQVELRAIMTSMNQDLLAAQLERNELRMIVEAQPSRMKWFIIGGASGAVVVIAVAVLAK